MHIQTVYQLWVTGINYTLDFEEKITSFSKKITSAASNATFKDAAKGLEKQSAVFASNLKEALKRLGEKQTSTDNAIAKGMMQAAETMIGLTDEGPVRDAAVIVELNQQQLYRVATYGSMLTYAKLLGKAEVIDLLEQNLAESKRADQVLTEIATKTVNPQAILVH